MTKIVLYIIMFFIWVISTVALIWLSGVIDKISLHEENDKTLYSEMLIIEDKVSKMTQSCSLPYWVQDKIEQTYEYVTSATCINK